jgi:hypothetical protein
MRALRDARTKVKRLFRLVITVTIIQALVQVVGHPLGIILIISYVYAVILIIVACIQERGYENLKYALVCATALFAATGIANILLSIFFPDQLITINFN